MPEELTAPYYAEVNDPRPELSPKPADKRPIIYGIIAVVVLLLIFGGLGVWLFFNPPIAAVLRDISILFLGLGAFIIILLLIILVVITTYLVLKINDLVQLLNREVKPVLIQLQSTVNTAQGTTKFLSEQAVKPVITTASAISASRAILRSLFQRK